MKKTIGITCIVTLVLLYGCQGTTNKENGSNPKTIGKMEKLEDELDNLIPSGAEIEILAEGFTWPEGPVWIENGQFLLFSDVPEDVVYKWKEGEGKSEYLKPSGYTGPDTYSNEQGANGLAINHNGKLLLCQHGDRRIAEMKTDIVQPKPEFITIAGSYEGKQFNSPNDLAIHKNGDIYFTDPPYGMPGRENSDKKELDFYGVFKTSPDSNTATLLVDSLTRPNGIAFNPDYSICYVNVSDPDNPVTMAYDVDPENGTLNNGRVFFDHASLDGPGLPDGLKVHPSGYIFSTGPGGVLILSPEGKHIGTVNTTQATANCAFDNDYGYLYMTANDYLLRIKLLNKS